MTATIATTAKAEGSVAAPPRSAVPTVGFGALRARFPDLPSLSGTGVACGADRCGKGQLCCQQGDGERCVPAGEEAACRKAHGAKLAVAAACDESSDCAQGERCCGGRLGKDEDGIAVRCTPAIECDKPWGRAGGLGIPAREVCTRGARCDKPDTTCLATGECVSAVSRVACGPQSACPADRPWCLWDAGSATGECIPRGPWLHEEGVIECDDKADCPGALCCLGARRTFCAVECDPDLAYAPLVCRGAASCGKRGDREPSCDPAEGLPPGLGTCSW